MEPDKTHEPIAAAYRLKLGELQRIVNDGMSRTLKSVGGAQWNQQELVGAEGAEALQTEVIAFARRTVVELALVHVRDGQTDAAAISEEIKTRFVDVGLAKMPGAALYRQSHGFAELSPGGAFRQDRDRARFETQRHVLRRDVEDIVVRTLAENPRVESETETSERVKHVQNITISGGNTQIGSGNVMNVEALPPAEIPAEPAPPAAAKRSRKNPSATEGEAVVDEEGAQISAVSAESLLQNGLQELRSGCALLRDKPSQTDLRRALQEVARGIELVVKSFLAAEHWTLMFENPAAASKAALRSREFKSVGFEECIKRLQSITSMRVSDRQKQLLGQMRKRRNNLEHLGEIGNELAVRAAIGGALHSVASLVKEAAESGLLEGGDKTLHTTLAIELVEVDDFVKARWKEIRANVPNDDVPTCPACSQAAAMHNADWTCLFCGTLSSSQEIAESFMENDLALSAYSIIKDGGEWPLYECPECEDEALVGLDEDGYRCFGCDETFPPDYFVRCTDCDRLIVDDGEAPTICSTCFSNKVNKDD